MLRAPTEPFDDGVLAGIEQIATALGDLQELLGVHEDLTLALDLFFFTRTQLRLIDFLQLELEQLLATGALVLGGQLRQARKPWR